MSDITRSEAIKTLKEHLSHWERLLQEHICEEQEGIDTISALKLAIASLETDEAYQLEYERTTKSETLISLDVYKEVAWERDIAIQQLHELGYEFGEKIESTTKNDLPHCQHTDKEILQSFREDVEAVKDQLPNTKNDLGVDCISRTQAIERLKLNFPISQGADNSRDRHRYMQAQADLQAIRELPSVTPQESRWIPVTEDAPPKGTICLWCNKQGSVFTSEITYRSERSSYVGKHGYFSNGLENYGDIVAWMPLPLPWKGE